MGVRTWTPAGSIDRKRGFAQELRTQRPTKAEVALWERIRNRQAGGRFRRQHVILGWIVDFYSPQDRLVIEVDGGYHDGRVEEDARRDRAMARIGLRVIRFTNEDVLTRIDWVVDRIRGAIESQLAAA